MIQRYLIFLLKMSRYMMEKCQSEKGIGGVQKLHVGRGNGGALEG